MRETVVMLGLVAALLWSGGASVDQPSAPGWWLALGGWVESFAAKAAEDGSGEGTGEDNGEPRPTGSTVIDDNG